MIDRLFNKRLRKLFNENVKALNGKKQDGKLLVYII